MNRSDAMNHSKSPIELPPQSYIQDCLDYDQATGVLMWKKRPLSHFKNSHGMNTFNSKHAGTEASSKVNDRYFVVPLLGKKYLSHRVIWKLMTGEDPVANVDHRDTNKKNNSWINLRQATKQENAFNQGKSPRNKTGYKGVSFDMARGKFFACIRTNEKTKSLGRFDTAAQAHDAYLIASKEIHGEFLHI